MSSGASGGVPETDEQRILNALGQALSQNLLPANLSEEELAFVQRGMSDAVLGQNALVVLEEFGPQIQGFMEARA